MTTTLKKAAEALALAAPAAVEAEMLPGDAERMVDAVLRAIREPEERLGALMLKRRIDVERGMAPPPERDELVGNPSRWLLPVWRRAIDAILNGEG